MADPKPLEETVDDFIEAWEKFLLDDLNTEQVTDYIVRMLKAREALGSPQDSSEGLFEKE
tara:strand:- start:171 stop:350 length:180 start_codon:yes stop_codon:yes gene_type:complete